ncbi:DUF1622 domain-containing protein [Phenylobacterium sp. LjRoot219]|uniref:DUF1622 domain-containing protein n=1 Tax=Phenylobacterium sp. LjRoot219 TaxID=3342283 RepID=UPI003ECD5B5D
MEAVLREFASNIALAAELVCVLIVALGAVLTIGRVARAVVHGRTGDHLTRRTIFVGFASWIILALEFALAADIVRTAIAPTWDDIGQLAAIAAIRTGLNWFLERDVETARAAGARSGES